MGNSFVLFDVSIVIPYGQFHSGNRGYTQNTDFPWVKYHFPVGKRSSGTATNMSQFGIIIFFAQWQNARLNKQAANEEAGFDVERGKIQSLDKNIVNMTAESLSFLVYKIC